MTLILFPATYDGTALVELVGGVPRKLIGLIRGLDDSPEVRGEDTVIPGALGRVPRSRVWDHRTIELEGFIGGVGVSALAQAADMRAVLEELRALFDPTRDPAALIIGLEDGGTATISARPVNMLVPASVESVRDRINISLEAVEGDWVITPAGS